jgi:hypothetical protein
MDAGLEKYVGTIRCSCSFLEGAALQQAVWFQVTRNNVAATDDGVVGLQQTVDESGV